jgi:hypothetical protein
VTCCWLRVQGTAEKGKTPFGLCSSYVSSKGRLHSAISSLIFPLAHATTLPQRDTDRTPRADGSRLAVGDRSGPSRLCRGQLCVNRRREKRLRRSAPQAWQRWQGRARERRKNSTTGIRTLWNCPPLPGVHFLMRVARLSFLSSSSATSHLRGSNFKE